MPSEHELSTIQTLYQAAVSVIEGLSLPTTLERIADTARTMIGAKYAAVGVPSTDGTIGLRAFIASGLDPNIMSGIDHEPVGIGLLGAVLKTDEPIRLTNLHEDSRSKGFCENHPMMTSFLGVPIVGRNDQRLGNLYLCDRVDGKPFSEEDENLVKLFATFAAIAIENAKLHQRLQVAVLRNERDRIGMELHDGIIQEIYAVGMKLEIMRGETLKIVTDEDFQSVLGDLNKIIDDIRTYILNLNTANQIQASTLKQQIENLVLHFRDFSRIPVKLEISEELPGLTDNQRHSIAQIIREALANVARHSQASYVNVTLYVDHDNKLHLKVNDNGKGMDIEKAYRVEHFGLRNIEQRVRRLHGVLTIDSEIGQGTTIDIVIPAKQF